MADKLLCDLIVRRFFCGVLLFMDGKLAGLWGWSDTTNNHGGTGRVYSLF
jgi:hypothetical protein